MSNIYKFNISDIHNINLLPSNTTDTPYFIEVQDVDHISNINNKLKSLNRYVVILFKNNTICSTLNLSNVFNGCVKLVSIDVSPFINSTNTSFMFEGCTNLKFVKNCKFNKTTNAQGMFKDCTSLQYIDWLDENFKAATNTDTMFKNCSALTNTINLSDFSVSTSATDMFTGCTSLKRVNYLEGTKAILLNSIPSSVEKKLNKVNYIKFITTETLKEFVKKAKAQIDIIANKITNLNTTCTTNNSNYNNRLNEYNINKNTYDQAVAKLATAETKYGELENLVNARKTEETTVLEQISTEETKASELETKISTKNAEIETEETKMQTVSAKVEETLKEVSFQQQANNEKDYQMSNWNSLNLSKLEEREEYLIDKQNEYNSIKSEYNSKKSTPTLKSAELETAKNTCEDFLNKKVPYNLDTTVAPVRGYFVSYSGLTP